MKKNKEKRFLVKVITQDDGKDSTVFEYRFETAEEAKNWASERASALFLCYDHVIVSVFDMNIGPDKANLLAQHTKNGVHTNSMEIE
jgi:hypothetical protein